MANWKTMALRLLGAAAILGSIGCGSSDTALGTPADLTGYWQLYLTPTGGTEVGPSPVYLSQTGGTVDGAAINGTVVGNTVSLTSTAGGLFTTAFVGMVSGTTIAGTMSISGTITATGTFRLVRFTPTGTMTAVGTIQGISVLMNSTAAIGARDYADQGLTTLAEVEIAMAYGSEHLEIDFSPAGLAVGTLSVPGTITAAVTYRDDLVAIELDADGGTVTVTQYDGTGFAGSFALTLPGGGSLNGTFAVSWDIAAYDP
jgi:hypothetical protein